MWSNGAYGYLSDYLCWYLVLASLIIHTWCFFRLFPRRRARLRLILGNLLVLACMITFVGLIGETYVRFLVVETDAYGASLVAKRWQRVYPKLNSLFCRDDEWTEEKPPGVYRIAFVGDSFTYGWGINNRADRFSDLIQARFDRSRAHEDPGPNPYPDRKGAGRSEPRAEASGPAPAVQSSEIRDQNAQIGNRKSAIGNDSVEVMNVAWAAWGTPDERQAIRHMIDKYAVDEIVLCYLPNDIESLLPVTDDFDPKQPPKTWLVNVESSFLLDYLFHRVYAPRVYTSRRYGDWIWQGYNNPRIWAKQRDALHSIIELCQSHDVTLRVALLPLIRDWEGQYDAEHVHHLLADFFYKKGVAVADLLPAIEGADPDDLVVNRYDPHPNENANRLFADAIWNAFYAHPAP